MDLTTVIDLIAATTHAWYLILSALAAMIALTNGAHILAAKEARSAARSARS
jgi:hypothetical protein